MMGRCAEGGCGTEEKYCSITRPSSTQQQYHKKDKEVGYVDFHEQARKALVERSPFDSSEDGTLHRVSTLPTCLADFLSKFTTTGSSHNKRLKKSHHSHHAHVAGGDSSQHHLQVHAPTRTTSITRTNIWAETQDFFRPVILSDIDNLLPPSVRSLDCFTIPPFAVGSQNLDTTAPATATATASTTEGAASIVVAEVEKNNNEEQQEVCDGLVDAQKEKDISPVMSNGSGGGLEWLLGITNKILLTSERPSKKRKLLGSDAGLEKLRVVKPCQQEGDSFVCHLCCLGDLNEPSNQFLVCNSCKVSVHQKCYGVQDVPVDLWLCSWCKYAEDCGKAGTELSSRPCLLCPQLAGALKPVAKDTDESTIGGFVKFVHLICSQWMPEVYIADTRTMEPVMNVKGIKDTRKRLVCNLCKVKYGACIRCSHGTCRTSFHPICAREAGHRMEIWGNTGCEHVELRAFCSKHSEGPDISGTQQSNSHPFGAVGSNSSESEHLPGMLGKKPNKLKLGDKNGEKITANVSTSDATSEKLQNSEILLDELDPKSNVRRSSQCLGAQLSVNMEAHRVDNSGNSLDIVQALKKLVDRGKIVVSDAALELGISSEMLAAILVGDQPSFPDLECKILKWLRNHAYMGASQQNLKGGDSVANSSRPRVVGSDGSNAVALAGPANSYTVLAKSPPPKKTKSSIKLLKDNKVPRSSNGTVVQKTDNGIVIDVAAVPNLDMKECGIVDRSLSHDGDSCNKAKDGLEKISSEPLGYQDTGSPIRQLIIHEAELDIGNMSENNQAEEAGVSVEYALTKSDGEHPVSSSSVATLAVSNIISRESSYVHPFIQKRLVQLKNGMSFKQENINPYYHDHTSDALKLEQVVKVSKMGILELSPEDEVEGQLMYFQNKLLDYAAASKNICDELIFNVIKALPEELDITRKQRWDSVVVNQYLCGIREAKKQGRKEKRHKEAQAVLAAATAAAAASSRISSFRKDIHDETSQQEVPLKVMPRAKETLSRLAVGRVSSVKPFGTFPLTSFMKEHPQLCDVCKRSETTTSPILVCCNCKVAVHLGCYRSVKDPCCPWYCELCEVMLPYNGFPANSREESCVVAHCGLCGGTTGAFRKSTDGQWVHAFCAEWLLESTFRRGQTNLVGGMEIISKDMEMCCICYRKIGLCIKCNFGNCQSTFHPTCARNSGFYMHVKAGCGKLQHKAYCEKHSLEQREKVEAQQPGPEELRGIKQIRVELERVRLLCERIIKREKLKREVVFCSHDILASKRDSVAFSVLVRSPFFLPDVSSESATTSLRGHVDDNRSGSEAMQRSEDISMDSSVVSSKRRVILGASMEVDQKTDGSSISRRHCTRPNTDRASFSGKQLPHRPVSFIPRNLTDDGERKSKSRKHTETFQKELVMTSDQASVQNQRLPKGFAYVPVVCLPKEKPAACEAESLESPEPDG